MSAPARVLCAHCKCPARPGLLCSRCGKYVRPPAQTEPVPLVEKTTQNPPYNELPESY